MGRMQTEVLKIETPAGFQTGLVRAAKILKCGGVVAVPTETVYGLAANAFDPNAVRAIFEIKGRPLHNPVIVHIASLAMGRACTSAWPESANRLAKAFWPGPITFVLPKSERIPEVVTAGGETVALRWPLHPFMRELIGFCGFPLAAPSANPANQLSPSDATHVLRGLSGKIELIIDAGPSSVGIESTVVDLTSAPVRILRPGMISRVQIENALGQPVSTAEHSDPVLKSPGLLQKHYSPRAELRVVQWNDDAHLLKLATATATPLNRVHVLSYDRIPQGGPYGRVALIPHDPEAYARALYGELHLCDELNAGVILVEAPPAGPAWDGIRDRLRRASSSG